MKAWTDTKPSAISQQFQIIPHKNARCERQVKQVKIEVIYAQ